ncbi:MAG: hypothetical protein U0174_13785 [Polyangiaceae bacterium]
MSAAQVSVVLTSRRGKSMPPVALEAGFSVLVNAAPLWFGLRDEAALALSDMDVQVGGRGVAAALAAGELGIAPIDLRLPDRETPATYLAMASVLDGRSTPPRDLARRFGFEPMLASPIGKVPPHVRRAIGIATAYQTGAKVLVLEDPLDGLPVDVAEEFTRVLANALAGRQVLWLAPRLAPSMALSSIAGEALWFHGTACVKRGKADAATAGDACRVSVVGSASAFSERLGADGVACSPISEDAQTSTWLVHTRATWRIFAAAADVGATVTELEPLLAFA